MKLSYELTKDEAEDFKAFYKEKEGKLDDLKIALTRFNETYRREGIGERKYEDVFIDCCIAFESLFCKDTRQKGEIIATGASMLLGKDNNEREDINNYLRKAYGVRNDIVHASLPISDSLKNRKIDDDLEIFISKVEDYLRLCIKKLIS
ncbi:MAG: HEPN domain-containing protein [Candidatus Bathyarchaeota archaeon]|nr:HEPN domain-containing protein [Candidatus Bathyarchaeota archaeon]